MLHSCQITFWPKESFSLILLPSFNSFHSPYTFCLSLQSFCSVAEQCRLHVTSVKTVDVHNTKQSTDKHGSYCIFEIHTCEVVKDLSTHWQERLDLCSCNYCVSEAAGEDWPYVILSSSGFSIFRAHLTFTGRALSTYSLCKYPQPLSYLCQQVPLVLWHLNTL